MGFAGRMVQPLMMSKGNVADPAGVVQPETVAVRVIGSDLSSDFQFWFSGLFETVSMDIVPLLAVHWMDPEQAIGFPF